jgi:hypothetical protein
VSELFLVQDTEEDVEHEEEDLNAIDRFNNEHR